MKPFNFSLSFIFFIIGSSLGYMAVKGALGWWIGRRIDPPGGQKKIIAINKRLLVIIPIALIITIFLYQAIRYQKDTFGPLDLKYDRFQGKTYILNTRDPKAEWRLTGAENMRTLKYYLQKNELESAIERALPR